MASSIPTARTNLVTILTALTDSGQPLEGVQVVRTGEWEDSGANEVIAVLNARNISRDYRVVGGGGTKLDEDYDIPVLVRTYLTGAGLQTVEDRLWAIVAQVEKAVVTNRSLTNAVRLASPRGSMGDDENSGPSQDPNVVVAQVTLRIACEADVDLASA